MSNDAGNSQRAQPAPPSPDSQTRSRTTATRSSRHSTAPETSTRLYTSSETSSRTQSLSYRQLLQQRLQKYQWTATFHATRTRTSTARNPLWSGSFWMGGIQIGQSSSHTRKDAAKEEAAKAALNWLNTYGYH
ncbi:hypothetical protein FRC19_009995 [Serendipita sp. 401]|nr:hypothetical protein FRC15_010976 [Serendipita sp. 397]KAG8819247.1 hypothetical protein FRC19_009995 [Serendipita sp. 401]KAG8865020.1 hypothetical protein FRC20_009962 [Serendipita sp. 405]KAG9052870.1 hypothetical protein FS842_009117 [Serendipita sp. 407]